jgi:hypothetical protein
MALPVPFVLKPDTAYMEVPRCDSCRFWKSHAPGIDHMGDCELFECRGKAQVHHESKLIVSRTHSGEATIITMPDFGCVQWESGR